MGFEGIRLVAEIRRSVCSSTLERKNTRFPLGAQVERPWFCLFRRFEEINFAQEAWLRLGALPGAHADRRVHRRELRTAQGSDGRDDRCRR